MAEFACSMTVIALSRERLVGDKRASNLPLPTCPGVSPGIFLPLERAASACAALAQFLAIDPSFFRKTVAGSVARRTRAVEFDSRRQVRRKSREPGSAIGRNGQKSLPSAFICRPIIEPEQRRVSRTARLLGGRYDAGEEYCWRPLKISPQG